MSTILPPSNIADDYFTSRRWRAWKNVSNTTCPPYGLVQLGTVAADTFTEQRPVDGRCPDGKIHAHMLLGANGPNPVKPNGEGSFTQDWPVRVLSQNPPDKMSGGQPCGPKASSWLLWSGGLAFDAGARFDSIFNDHTVVEAWPREITSVPTFALKVDSPDGDLIADGSGGCSLNPLVTPGNAAAPRPGSGLPSWCFDVDDHATRLTILHGGVYTGLAWVTVELLTNPAPTGDFRLGLTVTVTTSTGDSTSFTASNLFPGDGGGGSGYSALWRGSQAVCLPFGFTCDAGSTLALGATIGESPAYVASWQFGAWLYAARMSTHPYRALGQSSTTPVPRGSEPF